MTEPRTLPQEPTHTSVLPKKRKNEWQVGLLWAAKNLTNSPLSITCHGFLGALQRLILALGKIYLSQNKRLQWAAVGEIEPHRSMEGCAGEWGWVSTPSKLLYKIPKELSYRAPSQWRACSTLLVLETAKRIRFVNCVTHRIGGSSLSIRNCVAPTLYTHGLARFQQRTVVCDWMWDICSFFSCSLFLSIVESIQHEMELVRWTCISTEPSRFWSWFEIFFFKI